MIRKRRTKAIAFLTSIVMAVSAVIATPELQVDAASVASVPMFRLYNLNSGEHFYTSNESERSNLESVGWKYEGIGWYAPKSSNTPVYRLYNPNTGDHHFTTNSTERKTCIKAGWKDEKIGWYSDDKKAVPLYREYNPNVVTGTHNYTKDKGEHDILVSIGWRDEGIGWYGVTPPDSNFNVGDIVILGSYEQDNNLSNGAEPIEWQVIGTRDGHTLLLSKYALDCKEYNEGYTEDITWENCTLRSWLNNSFYNTAFSAADKKRIASAHNENPDTYELYRCEYGKGAKGGNATDDKVFLLSWTEARDYLDAKALYKNVDTNPADYSQKVLCKPTAFTKAQGVYTFDYSDNLSSSDTIGCCGWWLRSPGPYQSLATGGTGDGYIGRYYVNRSIIGVRPAILID